MNPPVPDLNSEWLEADGLGGFASGTVGGERTRRYHALLLTATRPPAGRMVLVNGIDAELHTSTGVHPISTQRYHPGVVHPDGYRRIIRFDWEPWPKWLFQAADGTVVEQEIIARHGSAITVVRWTLKSRGAEVALAVRPFLSGRDYHGLHHENGAFRFQPEVEGSRVAWRSYDGVPVVNAWTNGSYRHEPTWYRQFLYGEESARGLDSQEDLAAHGIFTFDLAKAPAILILEAGGSNKGTTDYSDPLRAAGMICEQELSRRQSLGGPVERAADTYLVQRGRGKTIVAGYPWFTDWGRDTFIALRGLCIATGRLEEAREILLEWSGVVSEGMLPNRFPDGGDTPEYNSVDASLLYIIAVYDYLEAERRAKGYVDLDVDARLRAAVQAILTGYAKGTRFGIRCDEDGLLACGVPGVQLTWMDAKVGDWVVTPRIGKPVEIQALWLNALQVGAAGDAKWEPLLRRGLTAFAARFWNEEKQCLYDVVDDGHVPGKVDPAIRPNQIFAIGGLPFVVLDGTRARKVVDAVEKHLLTPLGLRSLAPSDTAYRPRYEGGVWERDGAYHQGTVWPWLIGPFVEAWVRVRGGTEEAKAAARGRFLEPLHEHTRTAGLGHVSEIVDAEAPHTPRGCPFQAWSLGELIRLERVVLAPNGKRGGKRDG